MIIMILLLQYLVVRLAVSIESTSGTTGGLVLQLQCCTVIMGSSNIAH